MAKSHEKELSDLEKLLTALSPRPAGLDRDQLLYRAGQASVRGGWVWPYAAALMSGAAGVLALLLVLRPLPETIVRIVHVEKPVFMQQADPEVFPRVGPAMVSPSYPSETLPSSLSYWRMQQQALRFGVEGLPQRATEENDNSLRHGSDISIGSRPSFINQSLIFPLGEP